MAGRFGPNVVLLSIVIPAYNEALRLPRTLDELAKGCADLAVGVEIIVVVEKSTDETLEVVEAIAPRLPSLVVVGNDVQRGKGFALRTGVEKARGDVVLLMDADLSVPVRYIGLFLDELARNPDVDVLVGNRQHAGSIITVRQSWLRETMGKAFNLLVRLLAGIPLRDTQCGFKAFRRDAATAVFSRQTIHGFACDVEMLLLAAKMGFVVRDHPVHWENSPDSRVRLVRDSVGMLADVVRVRLRVRQTLRQNPLKGSEKPERPRGDSR